MLSKTSAVNKVIPKIIAQLGNWCSKHLLQAPIIGQAFATPLKAPQILVLLRDDVAIAQELWPHFKIRSQFSKWQK